ncbi:MAG: hypothetical protein GY747_11520 [Planctomycetes bacterium]|nr:hypothetical protein [Planctomycetota bacterium]MCP4772260.1 hypothetical protein [Planctomycetota bacterium]MCP4861316.1 hypothetical protein [Planctomycetota bacterium]
MLGILSLTLLAWAQQPVAAPFEMSLPVGFNEFTQTDNGQSSGVEVWVASRKDGQANFQVMHQWLGSVGAIAESVAVTQREGQWLPLLGQREHTMDAWTGTLDTLEGAGTEIRYNQGPTPMMIIERIAIEGDSMTVLLWEGLAAADEDARKTLDSFVMPQAWISTPPPEVDIYRGLGPNGTALPFPGSFQINASVVSEENSDDLRLEIDLTYVPDVTPVANGEFLWQLPPGARALPVDEDLGGRRTLYSLPITGQGDHGLIRISRDSFSALDALWLAVPSFLTESKAGYQPPAWTLEVIHPPHVLSLGPVQEAVQFSERLGKRITSFKKVDAGLAWPYFLVGSYKREQTKGLNWHLRLDSKAKLTHDSVQELVRLRGVLDQWLPGASKDWTVTSYNFTGDRVLPNLLVLDEDKQWFQAPVDAKLQDLSRRVTLARLLCQERFGTRLQGLGTAKQFLDASLAEYATWRLLQQSDNQRDAEELLAWWNAREQLLGNLPMPLSLLDTSDLFGAQRLLSFGPLVWVSIEQKLGRESMDAMLQGLLTSPRRWSTLDLEELLKKRQPDVDWATFLRKHVYGRNLPAND